MLITPTSYTSVFVPVINQFMMSAKHIMTPSGVSVFAKIEFDLGAIFDTDERFRKACGTSVPDEYNPEIEAYDQRLSEIYALWVVKDYSKASCKTKKHVTKTDNFISLLEKTRTTSNV